MTMTDIAMLSGQADAMGTSPPNCHLPKCHHCPHQLAMRFPPLYLALLLAACGIEQSQPAPDIDAENWGKLADDPDRPQQAGSNEGIAAAPRA
jgi:hypothetical protein